MSSTSILRFVQLSDLHLRADKNFTYHQRNPYQSFIQIVQHIQTYQQNIDFLLLSGDLADDQEKAVYDEVDRLLSPLVIPYYWIAGNHDHPIWMQEVAKKASVVSQKSFIQKGVHFILLNSVEPNFTESYGVLSASELVFLETALQKSPDLPCFVVLHHHPIPVGCAYMDALMLRDATEFLAILEKYPQIKAVLFGHIHTEFRQKYQHIEFVSCPATSAQFKMTETFALDDLPAGYRVWEVNSNGDFLTSVIRMKH